MRSVTAQAYLGAIGRTRTETVHVSVRRGALVPVPVTTSVDAAADPALAEQLRNGALNVVRLGGGELLRLAVPVVYHDPTAGLLVLVLCEAHRHRELDERIRVLEQLRDDPAEIPAYAKDFAVVFGGSGLRAYLDRWLGRGVRLYDTDRFEPVPAAYAAGQSAAPGPLFDIEPASATGPLFDIEPASEEAATGAGPAIRDPADARAALDAEPAGDGEMATGAADGEPAPEIDPAAAGAAHEAALDGEPAAEAALPEPAFEAEPVLDAEGSSEAEAEIEAESDLGGDVWPGGDPPITEITELAVEPGGEAGQGDAAPAPGWHVDDAGVHLAIAVDEAL
ncbi:MAG TPA: hypothetical protein VF469_16735, partial [Kofleriaceae bacterium]